MDALAPPFLPEPSSRIDLGSVLELFKVQHLIIFCHPANIARDSLTPTHLPLHAQLLELQLSSIHPPRSPRQLQNNNQLSARYE
jgi:hypothetical protein